jgi:hypothetical protein
MASGHRAVPQNLRRIHTSLRKELTKQLLLKDKKKKKLASLHNNLARLKQRFCLNTTIKTGH